MTPKTLPLNEEIIRETKMSDDFHNSQEQRDAKEENKQEAGNAENNAEENVITVSDNTN